MSNDYYNAGTTISRLSRGTSAVVNSIFQQIKAGFDALPGKDALTQGKTTYYTAGGTADALTVTMDPVLTSYVSGLDLRVKLTATNTGAATLNVNSLGVKSIKLTDGADPAAADLTTGDVAHLIYDGTNFVLQATPRSHMAGIASTLGSNITFSGGISLPDDVQASFGSGDTLTIEANATTATITESSSGNLRIRAQDIGLYTQDGVEAYIYCVQNGGVRLYYDNTIYARTVAGGFRVDGDLVIAEAADHAVTPAAGFGQFWVKDDAPCIPKFTDDAGSDFTLATRGAVGTSGDKAIWNSDGSLVGSDHIDIDITTSTAAAAYDIPATWKGFRIRISRFDPVTDDAYLIMRLGVNGSGGAFVTSSYAIQTINAASPSTLSSSFATETGFILTASTRISSTDETTGGVEIYGTNEAGRKPKGKGWSFAIGSDGTQRGTERRLRLNTTGDYDAIQLFCSSGNISNLHARIERAF